MSKNKRLWSSMVSVAMVASTMAMPVSNVMAASTNFNYAEALQKGILFYDFQKTGELPDDIRTNWRGDSFVDDGASYGVDLSGGFMDAGDNMKFNLPMAYTSTILAWSYLDDKDVYDKAGQTKYILDDIKWVNDYFIKCHTAPYEYYYQVGDIDSDHSFWGAAEVANMKTTRNCYKITLTNPGSCVTAGTAASLAACAMAFQDIDPEYAQECITHAKQLYDLAEKNKSDDGYNKTVGSCYHSWSGFYDELSWAGAWIYMATGDEDYLAKAEAYVNEWGTEGQEDSLEYKWAMSWDNVHLGATLLLDRLTGESLYDDLIQKHLDYWTTGLSNGARADYLANGLAVGCDSWGTLRYACNTAFLAATYAEEENCPADKAATYMDFAKSQADYTLGSTGRSFVCGFGVNPPENPHHRTAHGSWVNQVGGEPATFRHTLVGALVGGPDKSGNYTDSPTDYTTNEVACDYNAGFVGLMAKMYDNYGGTPLADSEVNGFETPADDELYVEAAINAKDLTGVTNFVEFKIMTRNHTAWPARVTDKLKYRIFFDITDVINNGYTADQMTVQANYKQYSGTQASKVLPWDKENNIYYVEIDLTGADIYPGGQTESRNEVQVRIAAPCKWDFTTSPSYKGLENASSNNMVLATNMALYDDGQLVFGQEPTQANAPEVAVTSPVASSSYIKVDASNPLVLKADASVKDSTITKVEYFINGTSVGSSTKAPYTVEYVPSKLSTAVDGKETFVVTAVATAANGSTTTSEPVTVKVQLPYAHTPEVSLVAPEDNATFDFSDGNIETIALKADATVEESTIKSVTFYVNGEVYKVTTDGNAELTVPEFSTAKDGVETYTVKAVAVAENGKKAESETATITVKLPVKEAPVVVITAPEAGNVIDLSKESQAIIVKADATVKGSTIDEVEFFVNGESIGKTTAGNYEASFTPSGYADKAGVPTEYVLTATATAANGTKATSEAVTIKVQLPEKPAPVVEVITPEANETFAEETTAVQVVATANIAEGKVSKVIFYADGEAFATVDETTDGVYAATYTVEGTVSEMGTLTPVVFTAEAVSDLGVKTTSDAVTVNVQKPVKVAPVVNFNIDVTNNSNGSVNSNTITNNFVVNHLGGDDIDLSKLTLRYFFTKDGATSQTVWCDNAAAQMNFAPWYVSFTGKVQGNVVPMAAPTADADSYIEIVFNGSDTIKAGAQLTIATRTAKSDWSNYDQSNDFSYGDSSKVAVYYDGELIAGMEP